MSFSALKKQSNLNTLLDEYNKQSSPETKSFDDDRFWKPELDKSGNGYAIIRFLPQPTGEDLPWCKIWSHAFNGPGGWYIENSLTTLQKKDPVSEYNTELWNSGVEANKEIARKQKRILKYYSNIVVLSDPKHPEHEGKVFLFRYGKKIFDKLSEVMTPAFDDETPMNPFDFWKGANFKLKIRKVDGFWNYDKSEFDSASELHEGEDEKLEGLYNNLHSLTQFLETDNFKSYDDLKTKLNRVLTGNSVVGTVEKFSAPEKKEETVTTVSDEGEEDTMSYFAKLADED